MNYDWLGYDVIEKSKYPNLLAEIKESGYSICTVSDHMGCNPHVSEDDPGTWNKLLGREGITLEESIGLVHLFNVSYEYLFFLSSGESRRCLDCSFPVVQTDTEKEGRESALYDTTGIIHTFDSRDCEDSRRLQKKG